MLIRLRVTAINEGKERNLIHSLISKKYSEFPKTNWNDEGAEAAN